jgi:hypothetical protein
MTKLMHKEWFWSQSSAQRAANRLEASGIYKCRVRYTMDADGHHDWLLEAFAA